VSGAADTLPRDGRRRAVIEQVTPQVDAGRFAIKRVVGELVEVEADVFTDGHDAVACVILYRREHAADWQQATMRPLDADRWRGVFGVQACGRYLYTVRAWVDHFETWRRDLRKRIDAGQDIDIALQIGAGLVQQAAARAGAADGERLSTWAALLQSAQAPEQRSEAALQPELQELMADYPALDIATVFERELVVVVEPKLARFSAWYEMFPRSCAPQGDRHGTFADCEARLPYVADMGFDVLYLPPVHPIGRTHRKGRNNALSAAPGDPGSPWAIGATEGGHTALHPQLGTLEDFRRLVAAARGLGIEVALDIAFQCAPDHPWVGEHPEWFVWRPDGTIQYAENPPKRYQDIYPLNFESPDWRGLWQELKNVILFWIEQGVTLFRVDNPHTKAFPFWEWVIGEVKQAHPETIFLAEAFTRPKVMHRLAKLGFSQSYNYFPWRNTKWDLTQYLTELTREAGREYFRPNLWPNTPDILPEYLQFGGRAGFASRLVLAATMGASYGIYGPAFELLDDRPRDAGGEEYLDSEKYQIRYWDLQRRDSLKDLVARINHIRRDNAALHNDWSLRFHDIDNEELIAYSKQSSDGDSAVLTVVNLDPHHVQRGWVDVPLETFGIQPHQPYQMHDLLSGARYLWSGSRNYVELDPAAVPAHIFRLRRRVRSEKDFDYFF
jgi:starch synthase (maltosyl-transferring)